jgi:hypothetical protein
MFNIWASQERTVDSVGERPILQWSVAEVFLASFLLLKVYKDRSNDGADLPPFSAHWIIRHFQLRACG